MYKEFTSAFPLWNLLCNQSILVYHQVICIDIELPTSCIQAEITFSSNSFSFTTNSLVVTSQSLPLHSHAPRLKSSTSTNWFLFTNRSFSFHFVYEFTLVQLINDQMILIDHHLYNVQHPEKCLSEWSKQGIYASFQALKMLRSEDKTKK